MNEVYDLHKHTHCVTFQLLKAGFIIDFNSTSTRIRDTSKRHSVFDCRVTYDNQKSKILKWGRKYVGAEKNTVEINVSEEKIYELFRKGENNWDQDDKFVLKALTDFIRLSTESKMEILDIRIEDKDVLHYICVVPSEWEEEIREDLIRPIFVQSNLLSSDDHQDRLMFCSDVESICYFITDPNNTDKVTIPRNTILSRFVVVEKDQISIKLDLIYAVNPLFDFSGSVIFPKIMNSNSISLTSDDVKTSIRDCIKTKFCFDAQEETIQNIMDALGSDTFKNLLSVKNIDNGYHLSRPFITDASINELDKPHQALLKNMTPFDICMEISKHFPNHLKRLVPNNLIEDYSILKILFENTYETDADDSLINWSRLLFEYNRVSFGSNTVINKIQQYRNKFDIEHSMLGATRYIYNAIQNSDAYSQPRELPRDDSVASSSIFVDSKPEAIMNIDISLKSTMLSFSLLDGNGLVQNFWDHSYFVPDLSLCSLGSFFSFSGVTSLNVKNSFIAFAEKYFENNTIFFSGEKYNKDVMTEMKDILDSDDLPESTQKQLSTLTRNNGSIKTGYAITVESMLLKKVFGTEDNLRDIIYESRLVNKNSNDNKLRITTHGEKLLPIIQQSFKSQFSLKSFFVVAQLYEDYVQLSLNQVVTDDKSSQESIVIQEELISTRNIYKSLCFNIWKNITEDRSLIQLCDAHRGYNDYELLELFSLENQKEFTNNLKEYTSGNILNEELISPKTEIATISLSNSCNCNVCLTENDITEISFRPVLQEIISLVFTSLTNNQLFGNYKDVLYVFHMIRFDCNSQFQHTLIKILDDETDYFLYDQKRDITKYTVPKLSHQPIHQQQQLLYKEFLLGTLYQVYSENYGFAFATVNLNFKNKNKKSDLEAIEVESDTVFPLFKKGDKVKPHQTNRVFYLSPRHKRVKMPIKTNYFKLKETYTLDVDETVRLSDTSEEVEGSSVYVPNFKIGHETSFLVSVAYKGYMSSLSLAMKPTGDKIKESYITTLAEPMTLARF